MGDSGSDEATAAGGFELPPLTRRECEVALLVAEGMSNRDIAGRLFLSERTAQSHVQHILHKLDFGSRAQIATWVVRQTEG
jgi:non-specific serine/threonine protein kinase